MNRRRAISMLEVMLASLLVSAVIISLMGTWPLYHQLLEKQKRRGMAMFLAQREMETVYARGFDGNGLTAPVPTPVPVLIETVVSDTLINTEYDISTLVELVGGNPLLKHVVITVVYDEKGGSRRVELETTLAG